MQSEFPFSFDRRIDKARDIMLMNHAMSGSHLPSREYMEEVAFDTRVFYQDIVNIIFAALDM